MPPFVEYLYHHFFLPRKLPGQNDDTADAETAMIKSLSTPMDDVRDVLQRVYRDGLDALFHVKAQNAGVLVRKAETSVIVETFELSPTNDSVYENQGQLTRQFPGSATEILIDVFSDDACLTELAASLKKMAYQAAQEAIPKVQKAKQLHDEDRDTIHPQIVTELWTSILRGIGNPVDVVGVCKHTREEVMWNKSKIPWRRSPVWLLIRVGLQLTMTRVAIDTDDVYKRFMVYMLATVLKAANEQSTSSDVLRTMQTKISGRLQKLRGSRGGKWLDTIQQIMSETDVILDQPFQTILDRSGQSPDWETISKLTMDNDTNFNLPVLEEFILSIQNRQVKDQASSFKPTASIPQPHNHNDRIPSVDMNMDDQVELWVATHLDGWIGSRLNDTSSPKDLSNLIQNYHAKHQGLYATRPEGASRMLLVILELWVAVDKATTDAIPLLRDYDPEIPTELFQSLLLGSREQMERLQRVETYIRKRRQGATSESTPSIFCSYGEASSFPVRFFSTSLLHKQLMTRIKEDAEDQKGKKMKQFKEMQGKHERLMNYYKFYHPICEGDGDGHHRWCYCKRVLTEANNLEIEVYEWPLPENVHEAQATVFELAPPPRFAEWRDVTLYLLDDVLQCANLQNRSTRHKRLQKRYPLRDCLSSYDDFKFKRRFHPSSKTKPHTSTHRKCRRIGHCRSLSDVVVNTGLQFQNFDFKRNVFLTGFHSSSFLSDMCTFKLPDDSQALKPFLVRTCHKPDGETPNEVIASQPTCPKHMPLAEYKALALLPVGRSLQWMNVLTQLANPTVDFNKVETATFLLQLSLQAGPYVPESVGRDSHVRLSEPDFGRQMLRHLRACVMRIQENWDSNTALWTFTFLAARILSMTTKDLKEPFLDLLRQCRNISYQWLQELRRRLDETTDDKQRIEFRRILMDICLTCVDSFNVDDEFLETVLSEPQQSSILVEVSILIYNINIKNATKRPLRDTIYDRYTYTLRRAGHILIDQVVSHNATCLDLAIKRYWSAFNEGSRWSLAPSTYHWLETISSQQTVHLNVLSGELLINGRPLSRLPQKYEEHEAYRRLFDRNILIVLPIPSPGMEFRSLKSFKNYDISFGMEDGPDLLLRLEKDGSTFDIIPPRAFGRCLPDSFVNNFTHWYHHNTKAIEFRPLKDPWNSSPKNWWLRRHDSTWRLTQDSISLLAPASDSAQQMATILSPLQNHLRIHMLYDKEKNNLEIKLPYLQLDFYWTCGESAIRSKQFGGMQISADQSIRTLAGFRSNLVLHDTCNPEKRIMIIPQGSIKYQRAHEISLPGHADVFVENDTAHGVRRYSIDNSLCRITDDGKLESKLYIAYLHALTSYCLPDPFTHRTGTEQALSILESVSRHRTNDLSQEALDLLVSIAALSPKRDFYPENKKVMQNVTWSPELSPWVQDGRLYEAVDQILKWARASASAFMDDTFIKPPQLSHTNMDLLNRDILRSSGQYMSRSKTLDLNRHNKPYTPRDQGQQSPRALRASRIAKRIYNGNQSLLLPSCPELLDLVYDQLVEIKKTPADAGEPPSQHLGYDSSWLHIPKECLPSYWRMLYRVIHRNHARLNKFQLISWLSTVSYAAKNNDQITQALLALAISSSVFAVHLPETLLSEGYRVDRETLRNLITENATRGFSESPQATFSGMGGISRRNLKRRKKAFKKKQEAATEDFLTKLIQQWPRPRPNQPHEPLISEYVDETRAIQANFPKWNAWFMNSRFRSYLKSILDAMTETASLPAASRLDIAETQRLPGFASVESLFSNPPPSITLVHSSILDGLVRRKTLGDDTNDRLSEMLDVLDSRAGLGYERQYVRELRDSLSSLNNHGIHSFSEDSIGTRNKILQDNLKICERQAKLIYDSLEQATDPSSKAPVRAYSNMSDISDVVEYIAAKAKCWPRVSPVLFLEQLTKQAWPQLSDSWKHVIVEYGLAITNLQRAKRLVEFQDSEVDLLRELANRGHQGWNPLEHPEWLLFECDNGIMIREVQQQIAREMIMPRENKNAVMQLNMGEGKSSVIVPIVAATLSDSLQFARVIVAKPQARQMHQIMASKLCGLLGRPVYRLPFSRAIRMDEHRGDTVHRLIKECREEGGILMVQPEHILSFQLMGIEQHIKGEHKVANRLLDIQNLFDTFSRDVVDESDENFNVKLELIYTLGQPQPIDHSPERWVMIQEVLSRFREVAFEVKGSFPQSVEIDNRHTGMFPKIRVPHGDAEREILNRTASSICDRGLPGFIIRHQPEEMKTAVYRYITEFDLSQEEIKHVESGPLWKGTAINHTLLLRGLFAHGILASALGRKRWRVNYGTDPDRETKTRLAVPFRAKDSPTPRSEFSHPEMVIIFTCLSYYYAGLKDEELIEALEFLISSDNAEDEYQAWLKTATTMPSCYMQLTGINLQDVQCTSEVFPHLRYSKNAVDYFLSHMVFAKELKEFPHKLSASGWDLGKRKSNATTGFSGTNDSRYILPVDVQQLDLPEQKHTNALVLKTLLGPENGIALIPRELKETTLESEVLLNMVAQMSLQTRVILDVGAQVIDLNNVEFAKKWLNRYSDDDQTQAVVFFDAVDELVVLDRSGNIEQLQTSPFRNQLGQCLVFLDEAHTRGTDLKLPETYQAAVTLGANLTKDRLVQACMRMRKLGNGQSVVFCIPKEIEQRISSQKALEGSTRTDINVPDVVCWIISETWLDVKRMASPWVLQGCRFYQQQRLWNEGLDSVISPTEKTEWAARFQEDEAQTLESRYRPRGTHMDVSLIPEDVEETIGAQFQSRCREFGLLQVDKASLEVEQERELCLEEEQERELSPEAERERHVEQHPPLQAREHRIHPKLPQFIATGKFPSDPSGFKPAFMALSDTSAAKCFDVSKFPDDIWVTDDFSITLEASQRTAGYSDQFQRPVQWILTSNSKDGVVQYLVIISPYEAQELLTMIEKSHFVTLHTYSPRVNPVYQSLDHLSLYTIPRRKSNCIIPRRMAIYLNLFAGQLYISSFREYLDLCNEIGLVGSPTGDPGVESDGFIPPGASTRNLAENHMSSEHLVNFLQILMTKIRYNGKKIDKTHVGKILNGINLSQYDFGESP